MSLSYSTIAPSQLLRNIAHDPNPGDRGFMAREACVALGANVMVPGQRHGSIRLLAQRNRMAAGNQAPTVGRAPGGPRHRSTMFAPSTATWSTTLLSEQQDPAVQMLPWLYGDDPTSEAARATAQRLWEEEMAEVIRDSLDTQEEALFSHLLFGTDGAGTGVNWATANLSASALNPGSMLVDDRDMRAKEFISETIHNLRLSAGGGPKRKIACFMGREWAQKWSYNRQLLGIHRIDGDNTGVAAVNGEVSLTFEGLVNRLRQCGIDYVGINEVAYDSAKPTAAQSNAWLFPKAFWIGVVGDSAARQSAPGQVQTKATAFLRYVHKEGDVRMKLNDDETRMLAFADRDVGFGEVQASFGRLFLNA